MRMRRALKTRTLLAAAGLVLLVAGACGGDETAAESPATLPPPPPAGQGTLTIGATFLDLDVAFCDVEERPADGGTTQLLRVEATSTLEGDDYVLRVTRIRTDEGESKGTITETIDLITGTRLDARGLQAKRSKISDRWVDLREPSASDSLIDVQDGVVRAAARFGPEGAGPNDPNLMSGQMALTCPKA